MSWNSRRACSNHQYFRSASVEATLNLELDFGYELPGTLSRVQLMIITLMVIWEGGP